MQPPGLSCTAATASTHLTCVAATWRRQLAWAPPVQGCHQTHQSRRHPPVVAVACTAHGGAGVHTASVRTCGGLAPASQPIHSSTRLTVMQRYLPERPERRPASRLLLLLLWLPKCAEAATLLRSRPKASSRLAECGLCGGAAKARGLPETAGGLPKGRLAGGSSCAKGAGLTEGRRAGRRAKARRLPERRLPRRCCCTKRARCPKR